MRKASILLVEIGFQETFIRAGSDSRNAVHAGRQLLQKQSVQCRFSPEWQFV